MDVNLGFEFYGVYGEKRGVQEEIAVKTIV